MKIEALEAIKADGYVLEEGDTKKVPDETGTRWCAYGWARDVDGNTPTGVRNVIRVDLAIDKTIHSSQAEQPGE